MRKFWKRLLWTLGILVGCLLLAVVALRLFLPLDKVKEIAIAKAGERLEREVTIAGVGLSLRDGVGIELQDVTVGDPPGTGDGRLLEIARVDLKLELKPLLRREYRVHRLVLDEPRVRLWKRADGQDNFTFAPAATSAAEDVPGTTAEAPPAAVAVSVAALEIRGGDLEFHDEAAGTGVRLVGLDLAANLDDPGAGHYRSTGELGIDSLLVQGPQAVPPLAVDLTYDAEYASTDSLLTLRDTEVTINGFAGRISGEFAALASPRANGRVDLGPVAVADILALLTPEQREPLQDLTLAGQAELGADLDWNAARAEPLAYQARIVVNELVATHREVPGELRAASVRADVAGDADRPEPASFRALVVANELAATYDEVEGELRATTIEAEITPDLVELRTDGATFAGEPLRATLVVRDFADPRLEVDCAGVLDLGLARPFLPPDLEAELDGRGEFDLTITGRAEDPDNLRITGDLSVAGARLASPRLHEPLTRLDAALSITPDAVEVRRCEATFPSGDLALTGRLDHPRSLLPTAAAGAPRPHLAFVANSRRFDVDKLFPAAAPGAESTPAPPAAEGAAQVPTPEMPDLTAAGTFQVDTLIYSRVPFTRVQGKATYADRQVVCDDVTADVYSGRAAGSVHIGLEDLNDPTYAGEFRASAIEADDFISRFTRFGGAVFGKTALEGSFRAAGRDPERIKQSLTLDASASLTSGRLVTTGFVQSSLGSLAQKAGADLSREQILRDLATAVKVADGKVMLDRLRTKLGTLGDLSVDGHYSFTGDLDYRGALLLTPATTQRLLAQSGPVGELLGSNAPDRLNLPLTVGGSLQSPHMDFDYAELTQALTQSVADEAQDQLKDLLKKKFGK